MIDFIKEIEHVDFLEAVQRLADRAGIQLEFVEGDDDWKERRGQRTRLVEAHKLAAKFYRQMLATEEGTIGREFLTERGFDDKAAEQFTIGYSPKSWDSLTKYLLANSFTEDELITGGLSVRGSRGVYDRFRGRLMWPIADLNGDIIGFGARKLHDDDDGPKYLNTPETPVYKKSQVLYGLNSARRDISKNQQAVIVEGYTDVMACHLAGITTAVATCGTAFGSEHIKVLRRLLMDDSQMRGSVIFTFDGDAAGQKAALRAFEEDQKFMAATFVAIEPNGMDPCELRIKGGDDAVRDLIADKVPLFEFAIRTILTVHDLTKAEGRVNAIRDAAPIVAKIKDQALRPEYERLLAKWVGVDVHTVTRAVQQAARSTSSPIEESTAAPILSVNAQIEREALKCVMQLPAESAVWYEAVEETSFTHPTARKVHEAVLAAGGPTGTVSVADWVTAVLEACTDEDARKAVQSLAVEPLPMSADGEQAERYAVNVLARLLEFDALRRIDELKSRIARAEADENFDEATALFPDLLALEEYRRSLKASIEAE